MYPCIVPKDKADHDKSINDLLITATTRATTTELTEQQWMQQLPLRTLGDVSTTMVAWLPLPPVCPLQPLPTWGTLFTLLIHLVPWGSFVDGALTTTTITITMMKIKPTRMTSHHLSASNSPMKMTR
jgi:hypothetical protein